MGSLFKYLASFAIHLAWQQSGQRGAVPPLRLPRRGVVKLPAISSWQVLAMLWLLRRIWAQQGPRVKAQLETVRRDAQARRAAAAAQASATATATATAAAAVAGEAGPAAA